MAGANNPPLIIKVGANLEELKKALSEGRVLIDNTSTSLGRMTASLRGDKLLQDAQKLVQSVQAVGGAATLTERQQARVNAQLQEAIQKYGLLGPAAQKASGIAITEMRELEKATHQTTQKTSFFQEALGELGPMLAASFSVGAVLQFGRVLLEDADNLVRLSDKTGIAIESLQTLQFAAKQSGLELETVTTSVTMMQKRLAGDDKSAMSALTRLGIAFSDFKDLSPDEQFKAIAIEVAKVEDPMMRAKIATDLFGKGGGEVLPLLVANFEALTAAAPKMSDAAVRAFDDVGDAADAAMARFKATLGNLVGGHLAQIYEGLDNIKALIRADGSIDWGVAAGGALGRLPTVRPGALWKPAISEGLDTSPATDRDIANMDRLTDGLTKQAKAVDLLKVSTHGLNDDVVVLLTDVVDGTDALARYHESVTGLNTDGLIPTWTTFTELNDVLPEYEGSLDEARNTTDEARKATKTWRSELSSLSQSFRMLQSSAGEGGLGHFAQAMANLTGSMDMGVKGATAFSRGLRGIGEENASLSGQMASMASGALQMAAAMEQATQSTSHWENALSGAATGAAMASQMSMGNPYATAAGGLIGALYGYYKSTPQDDITDAQRQQWADTYGGFEELRRQVQVGQVAVADYNTALSAGVDGAEAFKAATDAIAASMKEYKATLDALGKAAQGTKTIADAMGVATTQAQFERLGTYTSAIFGKMLRETGSLATALAAVTDTLDSMIKASADYGLAISGPVSDLVGLRNILTNNADLAARITGLGQIGGLGNLLGPMNLQATFGADIADTFKELTGRGGASEAQAMLLMQGPMQALWESTQNGKQQQLLDDDTQRLMDRMLSKGYIGENMATVQNQQLNVLTQIRDLLAGGTSDKPDWNAAALKESGAIAAGYSSFAAMEAALASGVNPQYTDPTSPDYRGYAEGTNGFEYFGSGTPTTLHGWEAVVPRSKAPAFAASVAGSDGVGSPVSVQFYEIHAVDADGFEQLMAKKGVPAFTKAVRTNAYKNNPELAATLRNLVN